MKRASVILATLGAFIAVAAGVYTALHNSPASATSQPASSTAAPSGGARSPGERQPPVGPSARPTITVKVAVAVAGSIATQRETIGWIAPVASTVLTAQQAGVVTAIAVKDGATVTSGDLIATLDSRAANAAVARDQAALSRDKVALAAADRLLSEAQALLKTGAGTKEGEASAQSARDAAAAVTALDNATLAADQVTVSNTEIRAPYDGRLGAMQVSLGSLVQPGGALVTLTAVAPVEASFSLPESDLAAARAALAATTPVVSVKPRTSDGQAMSGPFTFIDSTVDRTSGTFKAAAILDNASLAFWPGQSVTVDVALHVAGGVVLVPTVAVRPVASGTVVYVVGSDQRISARPVSVVGIDGSNTGVSSGVRAGERVVVEGQVNLTDGMLVATAPASAPAPATTPTG